VIIGLFVGNVLATLSWRLICAPVAVRARLTTYYHLELICGKRVLLVYNLFAGVTLSVLAGAMCTVSATAVGVLFNVRMPGLHDWLPSSWAFSGIVLFTGIITSLIASFGYKYVSRVSLILGPYMLAVIIYMCVESLRLFEINSWSTFWDVASTKIWTGREPEPGFEKFGLLHCICSAWFCDLMLHIGMLDLTILRYGKTANVGWCSAIGMYAGHYFTWIVAGLLYALQLQADPDDTAVKPGPMANAVAGANGLLCVVAAGWSTANPMIYEAGLAIQAALGEKSDTRAVTFSVGLIAAIAGLFPAVVMRILELLAYGGVIIMPMGVVIFCDYVVLPALCLQSRADTEHGTNWPAIAAWVLASAVTLPLAMTGTLAVFFVPLPGIAIAVSAYVGGSWLEDRHPDLLRHRLESAGSEPADLESNCGQEQPEAAPQDENVQRVDSRADQRVVNPGGEARACLNS